MCLPRKFWKPLEHSVLDNADPPDWHVFAQEVLEPLEHSVLDAAVRTLSSSAVTLLARLARMLQGALLAQMGPFGTLSSSDCHPAGRLARMLQGGLLAQINR